MVIQLLNLFKYLVRSLLGQAMIISGNIKQSLGFRRYLPEGCKIYNFLQDLELLPKGSQKPIALPSRPRCKEVGAKPQGRALRGTAAPPQCDSALHPCPHLCTRPTHGAFPGLPPARDSRVAQLHQNESVL